MIVKEKITISQISWLSTSYKLMNNCGIIENFYEPETLDELVDICKLLFIQNKKFLVIGHTSNLYFHPECHIDIVVSTRKCATFRILNNCVYCECGVSVMKLSQMMCDKGISGYEGLIDLPGTVGSSIYGNSSAFGCSINSLLLKCDILLPDGSIKEFNANDLLLSKRSSALKSGALKGVIISALLYKQPSDKVALCKRAEEYRQMRKNALPGPANNLGSVFRHSDKFTLLGWLVKFSTKVYVEFLKLWCSNQEEIRKKRLRLSLILLGARDLEPYVYGWNLYMWTDEKAHKLFPKFIKKHNMLYKNDSLEIEIIK